MSGGADAASAAGQGEEVVPVAADDLPRGGQAPGGYLNSRGRRRRGGDEALLQRVGDGPLVPAVRANRAFVGRAVRFLAGQAGVRQFLDIGSGIPTENNVHQVAQALAPGSRVVYADNDEIAVAHSRLMLQDNPDAAIIQADLREPAKILADPETQLLLDFSQPVAVLLVAVLHFIPDDAKAADILATLRGALAPGSYLVICHNCQDERPGLASSFENVYNSRVTAQLRFRTRDEIARLCDGFTLIDPGLVWIPQWRPDSPDDVPSDPENYWGMVGVARYDGP